MTPFCMLLTTPRSGSHLLMSSLAAQGTVLLAEYTTPYVGQLRADGRVSDSVRTSLLADIANADASRAKSRIGELGDGQFACRGTKLFPLEVELICLQWGSLERFFDAPDARLIRLRRRDLVAQAVSQFLARKTGEWFAYGESQQPLEPLEYDGEALRQCLEELRAGEALLDRYLGEAGDRLVVVDYEQLLEQPQQTLRMLAAHCGHALDPERSLTLPQLFHKQARAINRELAERLREQLDADETRSRD